MSQPISKLPAGAIVVDPQTTYYNKPITWIILEHGYDSCDGTTLLSEKILCLKAFDAKEPSNENTDIQNYGNSAYQYSNLLQWLNSDAVGGTWYTAKHSADQSPDAEFVTYNPYTSEAGFLAGFSDTFKDNLLLTHKIIQYGYYWNDGYEVLSSKIFLLSNSELWSSDMYEYFPQTGDEDVFLTAEAIANDSCRYDKLTTPWNWWLRTKYNTYKADYKPFNGSPSSQAANIGDCGVRPACQIASNTLVSDTPNNDGYYEIIWGNYVEQQPQNDPIQLTIGGKYLYGGYEWMCAEQLDNNTYVLQSTGVCNSGYPGPRMESTFDGSVIFDIPSGSRSYEHDVAYFNVANIDNNTKRWYIKHRSIEAVGGIDAQSGVYNVSNTKNGLYLIPLGKIRYSKNQGIGWNTVDASGDSFNAQYSASCYWKAMQIAAQNHSVLGAGWDMAVLGSNFSDGAWCVRGDGEIDIMIDQGYNAVFAPAFNIDARKIVLSGNEIFPIPKTRTISRAYIGINGAAKEIANIYIGVNGVAKKIFEAPNNIIRLGKTYSFGGYNWVAAEKISDNVYAMQSIDMTNGYWPGFYLDTDYNGTADFDGIDTTYNGDIDYLNVANYDRIMTEWYSKYGGAEADGGIDSSTGLYGSANVKNGLYLLPYTKMGVTEKDTVGSGNYFSGICKTLENYSRTKSVWLGTHDWRVNRSPYDYYKIIVTNSGSSQSIATGIVAPVFNIDMSKIVINGFALTLPVEPDPLPKMYRVYFNDNEGVIDYYGDRLSKHQSNRIVVNGETYGDLLIPIGYYHDCIGWFTDPEGGEQITSDSIVQLSDDQTLWAHWERKHAVITFDVNGGNPLSEEQSTKIIYADQEYGELPVPTKDKCEFYGWVDEYYLNSKNPPKYSEASLEYKVHDKTLYAYWIKNYYTIRYDVNGGVGEPVDENMYDWGTSANIISFIPTMENYSFKGWALSYDADVAQFSNSGADDTITSISNSTNGVSIEKGGEIVLYAVWESIYDVYGVKWINNNDNNGIRTNKASHLNNPSPAVGNGNGSSPFDSIMPWSGMKVVEDGEAGTLVEIPKFYYKLTVDGNKVQIQISMNKLDGYLCSPAHMDRGDGAGERDVIYVGRYHCADNTYKSTSNVTPQTSQTRETFRNSIHNLGSGIWQWDYAALWTIRILYLVEFGNWNSQEMIGLGCCVENYTDEDVGGTDSMQYHTGTSAADRNTYGYVQYRNIEGLWDTVGDFCDGIYTEGSNVYAIKNPSEFSDSANGTLIGSRSDFFVEDVDALTSIICGWNMPTAQGYEYALFPKMFIGDNWPSFQGTNTTDSWYIDKRANVVYTGGGWRQSEDVGLFTFMNNFTKNQSSPSVGSRLMKLSPTVPKVIEPDIYGAEWSGTSSPVWSRTDKATGFSEPSPAVNNGTGSSPFDDIMPWAGMKIVQDSKAGSLVEIPKFYYKWTRDGNKMKLQISMEQYDGFLCSPAHADRGDGVGERDKIYVGRYHCAASTYKSTSGAAPQTDKVRSETRTSIHSLGSDIWQFDYATLWTIRMLYLVEFANWDSQAMIGYGCYPSSSSAISAMGGTDAMIYHTGTAASSRTSYGWTQYRYIEGLWDHVGYWCDGIYFSNSTIYAIKNPANFSDTSNGTAVGTRTMPSGCIMAWTNPSVSGYEYALYPSEASRGDYSTYICDEVSDVSNENVLHTALYVGCDYSQHTSAGLFFTSSYFASYEYKTYWIGSRLIKLPS